MLSSTIDPQKFLHQLHLILSQLSAPDESQTSAPLNEEALEKFSQTKAFASSLNPWFTQESIDSALSGLAYMLRPEAVKTWMSSMTTTDNPGKKIGLILAGNVPMVGFHDILTCLVTGHFPIVKLSSQDKLLLPALFEIYNNLNPDNKVSIQWILDQKLGEVDAVIATGSNNTARYFEYYFGKYPNIIRKNRTSIAILSGSETMEELKALGTDIFSYFGLGCRNVSKLYIHENFDLDRLFKALYDFHPIVNHHKYANNYDYYKALWLLNREDLLDNGFMLLRPSESLSSPVGSLFYERYSNIDNLLDSLSEKEELIQCIVSKNDIPFGQSQKPELWDYADRINTVAFLESL